GGIGDQAQKLQRPAPRVAKLMHFIRLYKHDVSRPQPVRLRPLENFSLSFQHKDFVLIRMAVPRCEPAGGNLELTHREGRRAVLFTEERTDGAALRALHLHRLLGDILVVVDFHSESPWTHARGWSVLVRAGWKPTPPFHSLPSSPLRASSNR